MSIPAYAHLADAIAADIAAGRLKPGDRLPPQRTFAYQRGIAGSTASRVYGELLRRGLVVGEVGRGTFISGRREQVAVSEPHSAPVDLEFNFPILPEQYEMVAKSLSALNRPEALKIALSIAPSRGAPAAREIAAKAHRQAPLSAVYLQPALHNPLGITLTPARRADLARLLGRLDLIAIEDAVYSFLCDDPPLAAFAPEHSIVVDSLSKRIAPGLAAGFIHAPVAMRERLMASVRSGGWAAAGYALEAAQRMIADGTAEAIAQMKRADARQRQRIAAECLAGFRVQADSRAYHLWLTLPEPWRSEAFVAAAARRGIALTPSSAFTVGQGHAPNAVRLALASPPIDRLRDALLTLARLLRAGAEASDVTE